MLSRLKKIKDMIIYQDEHYNSFPNAAVGDDGEILVAFRQAPDREKLFGHYTHLDPASRAVYVTSKDNGETWDNKPTILYDDYYLGVQDPCINKLNDGTLFCTFFTWKVMLKADTTIERPTDRIILDKWAGKLGGVFTLRSADGGRTWDEPLPVMDDVYAVRGNIVELDDGSILLPLYVHPDDKNMAFVARTRDRGRTWEQLSVLATAPDISFQEPNLFRTQSGKLVAFIRSVKHDPDVSKDEKHPLFTCESYDQGQTWVNLTEHAVYSPSPFHAFELDNGDVLVTYGYRHAPYGIRAILLNSECTDWGDAQEIVLREDGLGTDIGYTNAVQLDNGQILVTYYYYDEQRSLRYIAGTLCTIE